MNIYFCFNHFFGFDLFVWKLVIMYCRWCIFTAHIPKDAEGNVVSRGYPVVSGPGSYAVSLVLSDRHLQLLYLRSC